MMRHRDNATVAADWGSLAILHMPLYTVLRLCYHGSISFRLRLRLRELFRTTSFSLSNALSHTSLKFLWPCRHPWSPPQLPRVWLVCRLPRHEHSLSRRRGTQRQQGELCFCGG
jgi:hypothetical protein